MTFKNPYRDSKGRVLLIAAQLPFAAVIGIKFSPEPCATAANNIGKLALGKRLAQRIECHCDDAARYPLPPSSCRRVRSEIDS